MYLQHRTPAVKCRVWDWRVGVNWPTCCLRSPPHHTVHCSICMNWCTADCVFLTMHAYYSISLGRTSLVLKSPVGWHSEHIHMYAHTCVRQVTDYTHAVETLVLWWGCIQTCSWIVWWWRHVHVREWCRHKWEVQHVQCMVARCNNRQKKCYK